MENKESLSPEQSLAIITDMINKTRNSLKRNNFYFILWGWVVVAGNLANYALLRFTDYEYPYLVWLIIIPTWIISIIHGRKTSRQGGVSTYTGKMIMWTWVAFTICLVILIFSGQFGPLLSPLILLLAGLCTFFTGLIIKFNPVIIGGSILWIFAVIAMIVSPIDSFLVSALAIIAGYLIPGYLLRSHKE